MNGPTPPNIRLIRWLTVLLFMIFAMTTDSAGVIIPQIVRQFQLSLKAAGAFHYVTMAAIALAAVCLGYLPDRLGRKRTIILGLALFAASCYSFLLGNQFAYFLCLLALSGVAIGTFKVGALALIGDISVSTAEHTATMNLAEGFFGCGAIIGPALAAWLISREVSWRWLYAIAGSLCLILIAAAVSVRYPQSVQSTRRRADMDRTRGGVIANPYALTFSVGLFLYVVVESAVYVWGPTYLAGYRGYGAFLATYAITAFFVFRALGRFLGVWLLARFDWSSVLLVFSLAICLCLGGSALGSVSVAILLLPLSGLFMSVIYPTLNSKGISCFTKAEHGEVAGALLFATCAGAVLGPLAMGAVIDAYNRPSDAFVLATVCSVLLFSGLLYNWLRRPLRGRLAALDEQEYGTPGVAAR